MRVFLDANVLLSASNGGSNIARLMEWLSQRGTTRGTGVGPSLGGVGSPTAMMTNEAPTAIAAPRMYATNGSGESIRPLMLCACAAAGRSRISNGTSAPRWRARRPTTRDRSRDPTLCDTSEGYAANAPGMR